MRKDGGMIPEVEEIWFDAKVVLFLKRFVHIQPRSCEGRGSEIGRKERDGGCKGGGREGGK